MGRDLMDHRSARSGIRPCGWHMGSPHLTLTSLSSARPVLPKSQFCPLLLSFAEAPFLLRQRSLQLWPAIKPVNQVGVRF